MFRSDRNRPRDYQTSRGRRSRGQSEQRRPLFGVIGGVCSKTFDRADTVRDVRLRDFHDRSLSRGQKLSQRATEERGCKSFSILRRMFLASQPRFLFEIEPDFHLLTQLFAAAQKIEFVFSRQSRNLSMGASEACASSPSRVNGETWQATHRRNPPCSLPRPKQRCCYLSLQFENSAAHDQWP